MDAAMKAGGILLLPLVLLSCAALDEPDFYAMSDAELRDYNRSLAGLDQVTCIDVPAQPNRGAYRLCGTLEEISRELEPIAPGVPQNSVTDFARIPQSRSTNPPQGPTTRPRIQN